MKIDARRVPPLAAVFEPPSPATSAALAATARSLDAEVPAAARALDELARELPPDQSDLAVELYTRTFELAPVCAPYLGVHLFGEESFTRAKLMTGLAGRYREVGFDPGCEVPDHVALVLRCAPHFAPDEWSDLVELCFARALPAMRRELERGANPYRHGVAALEALLESQPPASEVHRA